MDTIQEIGEAINECTAPSFWEDYKAMCREECERHHYVLTSTETCCVIGEATFSAWELERMQSVARDFGCLWVPACEWGMA